MLLFLALTQFKLYTLTVLTITRLAAIRFFSVVLFVCFLYGAMAQKNDSESRASLKAYDFFDGDSSLYCALQFDIKKFKKGKSKDKYTQANFWIYEADSITQYQVKIKARGVSRKSYCLFPPIKMKFGDESFSDPYFNAINNQKIVTHCKPGNEYEQNLLKEYLVYKVYNLITSFSYRTRLLKVTYLDDKGKMKPIEKFAFVVEEEKIIAERNNAFYIKEDHLSMSHINEDCLLRLSLFQFMIGNPDWSISGLHNVSLLKSKAMDKPLPYAMPYDFDYTGFVNPTYANKDSNSGLMNVTERKFKGICSDADTYHRMIGQYNSKKGEILLTINEFDLLKDKTRNHLEGYIEEFYQLINLPAFYDDYILPNCKK